MNILVIGSLNMDVVIPVDRYPNSGETVSGGDVTFVPGGKGANQALAAARLGANVTMLGMVGKDTYGDILRATLAKDGVDVSHLQTWEGSTGMAFVHLEKDGANRIILSPGANAKFLPAVVEPLKHLISRADALLLQLEIPMETVQFVLKLARKANVPVFLDPAPARPDLFDYIDAVDWITPNEHEAEVLTGQAVRDAKTARLAAAKLQQLGARRVLLKVGSQGAYVAHQSGFFFQPGFAVNVVDTTAAGDAFGAAFAVDYLQHRDVYRALLTACAAGALTTTKVGAQTSLPYQKEVHAFLKEQTGS